MRSLNKIFPFLPYLFVFLLSVYVPTDPDLGWHLKYGEYFFQHGSILRDNTFSTMMPDYRWANTSWLTDVLTYGVYHIAGFLGLSILGGIVVALTFYFFSKAAKLKLWDQVFLFPLILYLLQPINAVGFRGQQLTFLLLGCMVCLISLYPQKEKILYLLFPLFILWTNLHGQFILGIVLLFLWAVLYLLTQSILHITNAKEFQKLPKKKPLVSTQYVLKHLIRSIFLQKSLIGFLLFICFGSLAATLINPFGWRLHETALSHIGSPLLKDIAEYLPFEMYSTSWWNQIMAGVLLVFGLLSLIFKDRMMSKLPIVCSAILLFILSFQVRRYAWPAYYMVMPLLTPLTAFLKPDSKKQTQIFSCIFAVVLFIFGLVARHNVTDYKNYNWTAFCQKTACSPNAVQFMIKNNLTKNVFSEYGWGGWLIWNYPQIKPNIDGRMHLWHEHGYSAFADYYSVEQNMNDIDKTKYNVVLISPNKPVYNRLVKLENAGRWKMVYSDTNASVFVRN